MPEGYVGHWEGKSSLSLFVPPAESDLAVCRSMVEHLVVVLRWCLSCPTWKAIYMMQLLNKLKKLKPVVMHK